MAGEKLCKIIDIKNGREIRSGNPDEIIKHMAGLDADIEKLKGALLNSGLDLNLATDSAVKIVDELKQYIARLPKGEGLNKKQKMGIQAITGQLEHVKNIINSFEKTGLEITEVVFELSKLFGARSRGK